MAAIKQKIVTYLWFDGQAEEAAKFYTSIFKNSKVLRTTPPKGKPLVVNFQLDGQEFIALNGGPQFKFTEAISLLVNCHSQVEVDELWSKLTADGGEESMCGWLKDKYGLSWQIIPTALFELISDKNPAKAKAAMDAMLKMRKIDIASMKRAHSAA
jgi:predicted 3-demethylubiquinone-9 3-methyltransferase (glyoxalase superfamily)